jgi:hypothetical protein
LRARGNFLEIVMPGLVPGIHVFVPTCKKDVDGRVKPGHDEKWVKPGHDDGEGNARRERL